MLNAHRYHIQKDQNENGNFKSEVKMKEKIYYFLNLQNTIREYASISFLTYIL